MQLSPIYLQQPDPILTQLATPGSLVLSGANYLVWEEEWKSNKWIPVGQVQLAAVVPPGGLSSVPLPPSTFLLGSGILGLGAVGWRRKKV